jgi:hypothetical protein
MLLDYVRIFHYDGTLTDKSLSNFDANATVDLSLASGDYLYIAQQYPFTNIYFHMDTVNSVSGGSMGVEYWDGTQWREGVDLLDATVSGNAQLGRSGNFKFSIDDDYNWMIVHNTEDAHAPDELSTLDVYNCYWMRLQPTFTLSTGTDAKEVGYAFTTTEQLRAFDVEIDSFMPAFSSTKTDWIDEIKTASRIVVSDLKRKGIIEHQAQIIQLDDIWIPATLKTLSIIYGNLGPSYTEKLKANEVEYEKALNSRRMTIDENKDGRIDQREIQGRITTRVR